MDAKLAAYLVEALRAAGCEVFIDVEMRVGVDWSAEIERRIQWTDYLVVLLSAESIASEMVQAEVRRAHHAAKSGQRCKILPVRVAYEGPLGYELDGNLGKLQYVLWQDEGDNERAVREMLQAHIAFESPDAPSVLPSPAAAPGSVGRPEPKADMRLLRETVETPGSPLSDDNPFYIRRDAEGVSRNSPAERPAQWPSRAPRRPASRACCCAIWRNAWSPERRWPLSTSSPSAL